MGWVSRFSFFRQLLQGSPLGAERAAVDHVIGIPFDVEDPAVTPFAGVDDGAAAHRTITADGGGFFGILGLQHPGMGPDRLSGQNPARLRPAPAAVAPVIWINCLRLTSITVLLFFNRLSIPEQLFSDGDQTWKCLKPALRREDPDLHPEVPTQQVKTRIHDKEDLQGQPDSRRPLFL